MTWILETLEKKEKNRGSLGGNIQGQTFRHFLLVFLRHFLVVDKVTKKSFLKEPVKIGLNFGIETMESENTN